MAVVRHILIATPLGRGGAGGVDRLMDTLRAEAPRLAPDFIVSFATTRGRHLSQSPLHMAAALARIVVARGRGRLDLLHLNLGVNASFYRKTLLAGLCRLLRVPYVIHLHGSEFATFWRQDRSLRRRMIDDLFRRASGVIVLGTPWRDLVLDRVPELAGRVTIVPNAAPAPPPCVARDAAGPVAILFLGQLGARKGTPELVEALAAMTPRAPWRAVLAGDGAVAETRRAVAAVGLAERVSVPGWIGRAAATELLSEADILVLPSHSENLPLSVIEGMAAGLAVVATPVGALPDILHDGETGLIVAPGDAAGLAHALQRLVDDAALRRRLGDGARAFHRNHLDVPRFAAALAIVWRHAMDRGPV